jgi:hypothetical protein
MINSRGAIGGMTAGMGNRITLEETHPSTSLSQIPHDMTCDKIQPCRGGKPGINRLRDSTILSDSWSRTVIFEVDGVELTSCNLAAFCV